jgi:hypothetical protein
VTRTAWNLDATSRTLRTEVDLSNEDGKLRPGMYATARLKVAERSNALTLPKTAVMTVDGKSFCHTIDADGRVVRTSIETGIRAGDEVEIVSGLAGDEQVIGVNAAAFREGQQVEIASRFVKVAGGHRPVGWSRVPATTAKSLPLRLPRSTADTRRWLTGSPRTRDSPQPLAPAIAECRQSAGCLQEYRRQ